jgi:uncharacterized coiled-coil DUF342 family protein
MKLNQSWIVLILLTQVVSLSYAQYPLTKKIGNDTVVIMTIKQGEQINKSFDEYEEKVSKLKDTITILKNNLIDGKKQYDSSIGFVRSEISEYKWKYEENKKMYSKNEELFYKTHNTDILQKILLGVIVTFLFFKLN